MKDLSVCISMRVITIIANNATAPGCVMLQRLTPCNVHMLCHLASIFNKARFVVQLIKHMHEEIIPTD
jgi:hypothetical protein